jgi:hypothetical protein
MPGWNSGAPTGADYAAHDARRVDRKADAAMIVALAAHARAEGRPVALGEAARAWDAAGQDRYVVMDGVRKWAGRYEGLDRAQEALRLLATGEVL